MTKNFSLRASILLLVTFLWAAAMSDLHSGDAVSKPIVNTSELHSGLNASDLSQSELLLAEHYRIFDSVGNPVVLEDLIRRIKQVDVTFLGETHTDTIAHSLQALILKKTSIFLIKKLFTCTYVK